MTIRCPIALRPHEIWDVPRARRTSTSPSHSMFAAWPWLLCVLPRRPYFALGTPGDRFFHFIRSNIPRPIPTFPTLPTSSIPPRTARSNRMRTILTTWSSFRRINTRFASTTWNTFRASNFQWNGIRHPEPLTPFCPPYSLGSPFSSVGKPSTIFSGRSSVRSSVNSVSTRRAFDTPHGVSCTLTIAHPLIRTSRQHAVDATFYPRLRDPVCPFPITT